MASQPDWVNPVMETESWWTALGTWASVVVPLVAFFYSLHRNRGKAANEKHQELVSASKASEDKINASVSRVGADVDNLERQFRAMERDLGQNYVKKDEWLRQIQAVDTAVARVEGKIDATRSELSSKFDDLNKYLRDVATKGRS